MNSKNVLVTGGAGYAGSALVPKLLKNGYNVTVLDTFWFWESPEEFSKSLGVENNPNLKIVKGDCLIDVKNIILVGRK